MQLNGMDWWSITALALASIFCIFFVAAQVLLHIGPAEHTSRSWDRVYTYVSWSATLPFMALCALCMLAFIAMLFHLG